MIVIEITVHDKMCVTFHNTTFIHTLQLDITGTEMTKCQQFKNTPKVIEKHVKQATTNNMYSHGN